MFGWLRRLLGRRSPTTVRESPSLQIIRVAQVEPSSAPAGGEGVTRKESSPPRCLEGEVEGEKRRPGIDVG
jgi:hypothetical protein